MIPAAGVGKRMGGDMPKQYLELLDRPVIDHTIERLLLHPAIDGLYVALGRDDPWWAGTEFADHPDLVRVSGGAERCHSVLNALEVLGDRAAENDWVLVHDAARPCVRRDDISRLVRCVEAEEGCGGLLGIPVHDTMKRTDDSAHVQQTVDRDGLWHAFTPQMFRFGELRKALRDALEAGFLVTDEASAMERAGLIPLMVEGARDNIKITRPEDLALAAWHLARQASG